MGAAVLTTLSLLLTAVWPLLRVLRLLYDRAVHAAFSLFFSLKKTTPLPPVFNPNLLLSATQLAKAIRERKRSSVSVVRAYITRISDVNPLLNALAQETFQDALQEARRVDDRLAQGLKTGTLTAEELQRTQPLLGVPFTVKESIAVAGMHHTGGLISRRYTTATRDAVVVERLRRAGAILLATTNVSELGNWWESENRLYGATSNPYDLNRTPGGSSGGEAALMCACGTPVSVGSDIGGSLRTPAFFCGLFSHKPTPGLISLRGVGILESPSSMSVFVAGPITRHAEDLVPLLQILADPEQIPAYRLADPVNLANVKVFSIADDGGGVFTSPVCRELRLVQEAVAEHFLRTHDISVTKIKLPALQRSFSIWVEKVREETKGRPSITQQLADSKGEINVWTELFRAVLGRANHTWPSLVQALTQDWGKEDAKGKRQPEWRGVLGIFQRTLGTNGVLLYPSHPTLAPFHREPFMLPLNFTYTAIFNALGLPVTQVPLGLAANGLPLGIQVVGGLKMDRLTLAVAADLEKAFGGWRCPAEIL